MAAAAPARRRRAPARGRPAAPRRAPRKSIRVVRRNPAVRPAALGARGLDRLLRGRAWIACIGLLLTGVVFLNVGLLEMNRGITSTTERAADLRRENAVLRLKVARLASTERIQQAAGELGFALPKPGDVRYLRARPGVDARRAARRIAPPAGHLPPAATPAPTAIPAPTAAPPATAAPPVPAPQTAPPPAAPHTHAPAEPHTHGPAAGAPPTGGTGTTAEAGAG